MPEPPADLETETSSTEEPKLQFSYVECLMHTFHQLCRKHPDFLTTEDSADRLKDFRLRFVKDLVCLQRIFTLKVK